jgi:hypothetical protein
VPNVGEAAQAFRIGGRPDDERDYPVLLSCEIDFAPAKLRQLQRHCPPHQRGAVNH